MKKILLTAATALTFAVASPALAGTVITYTGDTFTGAEGAVGVLSHNGGTLENALPGAWNAAGWDGQFFRNSTTGATTLQVFNMPAHSMVTLSFLVGLLDSWDSSNGSVAPDYLFISIDDSLVASLTASNASGNVNDFGGGTLLASGAQIDTNQFYSDTLLNMSSAPWATFAHSASTLKITFQAGGNGWQGGTDEAWGIDNLTISVDSQRAVPEPASWALMIGGMGLAGAAMRRRRTAVSFA